MLLAKTFHELGINAQVIKERANCADVVGKSLIHGYSFVADAKAFRLSRTAKNQKDFKVKSMYDWKGGMILQFLFVHTINIQKVTVRFMDRHSIIIFVY